MPDAPARDGAQGSGRLPVAVKWRAAFIVAALVSGALLLITTRGNALLLDLAGMVGALCF